MNTNKRILSVAILHEADPYPDTSYLGEYTDKFSSSCIVRATGEFGADVARREAIIDRCEELSYEADDDTRAAYWAAKADRLRRKWADVNHIPERSREYRFFEPAESGNPVGCKDWRACAKEDFERMEALQRGEWCYLIVRADAEVVFTEYGVVQRITSGGICGVESDAGEYIKEVENQELIELRVELESVGFSASAIRAAFANIERPNA